MRAAFELYRPFERDAENNREALQLNGKLAVPVLAVGDETSILGPLVEEMMRELAESVMGIRAPECAHWIPQESPIALAAAHHSGSR